MAVDSRQWSLNEAKTSHLITVSIHLSLFFEESNVFEQLKLGLIIPILERDNKIIL